MVRIDFAVERKERTLHRVNKINYATVEDAARARNPYPEPAPELLRAGETGRSTVRFDFVVRVVEPLALCPKCGVGSTGSGS